MAPIRWKSHGTDVKVRIVNLDRNDGNLLVATENKRRPAKGKKDGWMMKGLGNHMIQNAWGLEKVWKRGEKCEK